MPFLSLGVVACSCNPSTWRLELVDGLRTGALFSDVPCRSDVRTKFRIDMVILKEFEMSRSPKEG